MTIEYEQFQGRPTNLTPMPLTEVRKLQQGDRVYLWWAKDGNLDDVRINEVCEVEGVAPFTNQWGTGVDLALGGGDIRIRDETVKRSPDANRTDWGGRGEVYFYYPPEAAAA